MKDVPDASPNDRVITSTALLFFALVLGIWGFLYKQPAQHFLAASDLKFLSLVNVVAIACFWMGVRQNYSATKILLLVLPWILGVSLSIQLNAIAKGLANTHSVSSLLQYSKQCIALLMLIFIWIAGFPFPDSGQDKSLDVKRSRVAFSIRLLSSVTTGLLLLFVIYMIVKRAESAAMGELIHLLNWSLFLLFVFLVARVLLPIPFLASRSGDRTGDGSPGGSV